MGMGTCGRGGGVGTRAPRWAILLLVGWGCATSPQPVERGLSFEHLATLELPAVERGGATLGGLSGMTWDRERDVYYAVSDDGGAHGPPRFYTLSLDLENPQEPSVSVVGWTELRGLDPTEHGLDFEGIALTSDDTLLVTSEGGRRVIDGVATELPPFLGEWSLDGTLLHYSRLPDRFSARPGLERGMRPNQGPEALALSRDGGVAFVGFEGPIRQDGADPTAMAGAWSRVVEVASTDGLPTAERAYRLDPVHAEKPTPDSFSVRGLVELLALPGGGLLAMERSYVAGRGTAVQLYLVATGTGDDITDRDSLLVGGFRPLRKEMVLDLSSLDVPIDNYEALALGPRLADGRQTLWILSDDNFNRGVQSTWLILFAF